MIELTWIVPMYRTAAALPELVERIGITVSRLGVSAEIVLVDDACPELSADRAANVTSSVPLSTLRLGRNVGQDRALREGLRRAGGQWAVLLDGDLQDPPEAVAVLWSERTSNDVVFARRVGRYESRSRLITSRLYRRCVAMAGGLPPGAGLFVLLERRIIQAIAAMDTERFSMLAAIAAAGGSRTSVLVVREPRPIGNSAYSRLDRLRKGAETVGQLLLARVQR
jgi:glycosyltransferase involved in cell wall biosynthesis